MGMPISKLLTAFNIRNVLQVLTNKSWLNDSQKYFPNDAACRILVVVFI